MVVEVSQNNLPWVEKYRPKSLSDLISHEESIKTLDKFIAEHSFPHLLLYGPPGTGKTSTILACAARLYTPGERRSMLLELNASDERGIDVVRGQIQSFASTRCMFGAREGTGGGTRFKLIVLDEADSMTREAQDALRRIIEKYTDNVRFCLICNYLGKITPAIQSRCTRLRFGPLPANQMSARLDHVIREERVDITEEGRGALLHLARGDMRRVLNILQATSIAFDAVTVDTVYLCTGHPHPDDINRMVDWMLNESVAVAYRRINELKTVKGIALQDIIQDLHDLVHRFMVPNQIKCELFDQLAELEHRMMRGASDKIQLAALVAAFQCAKSQVESIVTAPTAV